MLALLQNCRAAEATRKAGSALQWATARSRDRGLHRATFPPRARWAGFTLKGIVRCERSHDSLRDRDSTNVSATIVPVAEGD